MILDMSGEAPVVAFARIEYDIERAVRGIGEFGLPIEFAEHLRTGGQE